MGWNPTTPVPRTSSTRPSSSWIRQCRDTTCTGSSHERLVMETVYENTKLDSAGLDISGTSALRTATRTPSVVTQLAVSAAMPSSSAARRRSSACAATASSRRAPVFVSSAPSTSDGDVEGASRKASRISASTACLEPSASAALYPGRISRRRAHSVWRGDRGTSGSRVRLSSPTASEIPGGFRASLVELRGGSEAHLGEHVHGTVALNLRIDPSAAPQQAAIQHTAEREGHGAGRARESDVVAASSSDESFGVREKI